MYNLQGKGLKNLLDLLKLQINKTMMICYLTQTNLVYKSVFAISKKSISNCLNYFIFVFFLNSAAVDIELNLHASSICLDAWSF